MLDAGVASSVIGTIIPFAGRSKAHIAGCTANTLQRNALRLAGGARVWKNRLPAEPPLNNIARIADRSLDSRE